MRQAGIITFSHLAATITRRLPMRPAVLVTGAARRLGRHIALHLASQGWDVALHHRSEPDVDAASTLAEVGSGSRSLACRRAQFSLTLAAVAGKLSAGS